MRLRILVLPLAAIILIITVHYRLSHPPERRTPRLISQMPRHPAPEFEGITAENKPFRLQSYLGRYELLVVFFDGERGAIKDAVLSFLRQHLGALKSSGVMVVAVSTALPQQNREAAFPEPFVFVTDVAPICEAHRRWGCFSEADQKPRGSVFHINRAGQVATKGGLPVPLSEPIRELSALLKIEARPEMP